MKIRRWILTLLPATSFSAQAVTNNQYLCPTAAQIKTTTPFLTRFQAIEQGPDAGRWFMSGPQNLNNAPWSVFVGPFPFEMKINDQAIIKLAQTKLQQIGSATTKYAQHENHSTNAYCCNYLINGKFRAIAHHYAVD